MPIAILSALVITASAGVAFIVGLLLGRSLTFWELLLCGGSCLTVAWAILELRRHQERKRVDSMRDSALW